MRNQSGKGKVEIGKGTRSLCARTVPLSPFAFPLSPVPLRSGITLIEVLISMFVLLFGLMGVAAIFPVASHYILEGDKRDRSSGLAQVAFEELKARKILRPRLWVESSNAADGGIGLPIISPISDPIFLSSPSQVPHAFVIDPLGAATPVNPSGEAARKKFFPRSVANTFPNPWKNTPPFRDLLFQTIGGTTQNVNDWPVKRVTLDAHPDPFNYPTLSGRAAETAFRLRDDLAVEQPDAGDRPSIQRWQTSGGQLLSRAYVGDYSWLATVVPTSPRALMGLQPAAKIKDAFYEVTTVVFYKRDITPSTTTVGSPGSERLIGAEFINETELAIYDHDTSNAHPETVQTALEGIKPGNWIAVMGVNQLNGVFMLKWFKVQAMDDELSPIVLSNGTTVQGRYVMVQGPDWPAAKNSAGVALGWQNLRVAILPGAIDAYTRVMQVDVE